MLKFEVSKVKNTERKFKTEMESIKRNSLRPEWIEAVSVWRPQSAVRPGEARERKSGYFTSGSNVFSSGGGVLNPSVPHLSLTLL